MLEVSKQLDLKKLMILKHLKDWEFYLESCNRAYRRTSSSSLSRDYEQKRKTSMLSDLETLRLRLIASVVGFQEMMVLVLARWFPSPYLMHGMREADLQNN